LAEETQLTPLGNADRGVQAIAREVYIPAPLLTMGAFPEAAAAAAVAAVAGEISAAVAAAKGILHPSAGQRRGAAAMDSNDLMPPLPAKKRAVVAAAPELVVAAPGGELQSARSLSFESASAADSLLAFSAVDVPPVLVAPDPVGPNSRPPTLSLPRMLLTGYATPTALPMSIPPPFSPMGSAHYNGSSNGYHGSSNGSTSNGPVLSNATSASNAAGMWFPLGTTGTIPKLPRLTSARLHAPRLSLPLSTFSLTGPSSTDQATAAGDAAVPAAAAGASFGNYVPRARQSAPASAPTSANGPQVARVVKMLQPGITVMPPAAGSTGGRGASLRPATEEHPTGKQGMSPAAATIATAETKRRERTNAAHAPCMSCNVLYSLEWRRGPDGLNSLCNACGLRYARLLRITGRQAAATFLKTAVTSPNPAAAAQRTSSVPAMGVALAPPGRAAPAPAPVLPLAAGPTEVKPSPTPTSVPSALAPSPVLSATHPSPPLPAAAVVPHTPTAGESATPQFV
jgi:hypothetical protein